MDRERSEDLARPWFAARDAEHRASRNPGS